MHHGPHRLGMVSPSDWGLAPATREALAPWTQIGLDSDVWEERARQATYHWLMSNWRDEVGAFAGHYKALARVYEDPQLTNLIAPWQCLAAYDRFGDDELLIKARRAADWLYGTAVETHPMSVVIGGVHDAWRPDEIWTKFTAELVLLNLGLYTRLHQDTYLARAIEGGGFVAQAERHGFACKYEQRHARWITRGWQSFGRAFAALANLHVVTREDRWLTHAIAWAEMALSIQANDGSYYLIDDEYYSTDLAADELRALVGAFELTGRVEFCSAAMRFADWHLRMQREDGSWWLTMDRSGNIVSPYVGPGDIPNIAVALLRCHRVTCERRYLTSALRAMRYALAQQLTPADGSPFVDDPNALWGYWSWDPRYDHTMSGDQITHLARGIWFTLDYLAGLGADQARADVAALHDEGFAF